MAFRVSDGNAIEQIIELAAGYGIGGATSTALEPLLQSLRSRLWALDPSLPTDAATLALLVRLGELDEQAAAAEAAKSGVGSDSLGRLVAATKSPADLSAVVELYQRGELDEARALQTLQQGGLRDDAAALTLKLARQLLSAADLAMARQQEFISDDELHARAAQVGLEAADADLLYKLAGLPPGITEGLILLRRGEIDEQRFGEYVAEGHTKTKYTPDLLALRYTPLSASVAAEALIRERISEADAVAIAEKNGLSRDDFLTWSNMLGRPIATGEALTLVNRGQMTKDQFHEVVARSDVRTEYVDQLYELRVHYPTITQIRAAIHANAVPDAVAAETMRKEGFTQDWIDATITAGHADKTAAHKHLSLAIVETLFDAGLQDEPAALAAIEALGYDQAEATELLRLHEARRIVAELVRAAGVIRASYVNHLTDETQARVALDTLGLEASTKTRLLELWTVERGAHVRTLTPAQVGQALKYTVFTVDEAMARWQQLGYSAADAEVLAGIIEKGPIHPAAVT